MTPKRKSRKRRMLERQGLTLARVTAEHVASVPREAHIAAVHIRSPLQKPQVGYQGTFRKPKEVPDGADAPAFYKAGARMKPQKPPRVATVRPSHGRTNLK